MIALVASACCGALAWSQVRRVARATSGETHALAAAVRSLPPSERAAAVASRAREGTWERAFATELARAPDEAARVAAANDALAELEASLRAGSAWPAAAVRLAASGGLLLVAIAIVARAGAIAIALTAVAGFTGALVALAAGVRARTAERTARAAIDELVHVILGRDAIASPAPRRSSRASRR